MFLWEMDIKSSVYHICIRKRWRLPVEFSFRNVQNIFWKIMSRIGRMVVATEVIYHHHSLLLRNVAVMVALYVGY